MRYGAQFCLGDPAAVLLRRRPASGLLGGMLELPGTEWRGEPWLREEALLHAPQPASWRLAGQARHGFTHFELRLDVYAATVDAIDAPGLRRARTTLAAEALPTVMRKCLRLVDDFAAVFTSR
jgi:A/G-specific adenine glycosylase